MNRRLILACLMLAPYGVLPALAAKKTVALLPASVTSGRAENGSVITDALRSRLQKAGFEVLSADRTRAGVNARGMDLARPQAVKDLAELRDELGVDFVVYPRVLNVGKSLAGQELQANILLNIAGKSRSGYAHTRQVGQTFKGKSEKPADEVIGKSDAENAAEKLLTGFEQRAR